MTNYRLQYWVLGLLLVGVLGLSFFVFRPYLAAMMLALILVVTFMPIHRRVRDHLSWPSLSAFFSTVLVLVALLVPIAMFGTLLFQEVRGLTVYLEERDPEFLLNLRDRTEQFLDQHIPLFSSAAVLPEFEPQAMVQTAVGRLAGYLEGAVTGLIRVGIGLFIMVLTVFYLFRDGPRFLASVKSIIPMERIHTDLILNNLEEAINAVVRGRLLVGVIQGFVIGAGLTVFGVPNAILWGTVAAVTSMLPVVGPLLVVIPAALFLFWNGLTIAAIGLLLWGLAAVIIVDEYLGSVLIDQRMQIHPLLVLISVLGGITLFGPIGFVLGPVVLSLLFALLEIYAHIINTQGA